MKKFIFLMIKTEIQWWINNTDNSSHHPDIGICIDPSLTGWGTKSTMNLFRGLRQKLVIGHINVLEVKGN